MPRRSRSNDDWLHDLRSSGAEQARALEELRRYLLRSLPGALARHGPTEPALIEDIVQDTLVRALDRLDDFAGRSRFTTWVTTIAVRVALTELRRRRWKDVSLEDASRGGGIDPVAGSDPAAGPESLAAQRAILVAMRHAFESQLTERQRAAIVAELSGMPQEEIGRRFGMSRSAVYKLCYDARRKLKKCLEAQGHDAADVRRAFAGNR